MRGRVAVRGDAHRRRARPLPASAGAAAAWRAAAAGVRAGRRPCGSPGAPRRRPAPHSPWRALPRLQSPNSGAPAAPCWARQPPATAASTTPLVFFRPAPGHPGAVHAFTGHACAAPRGRGTAGGVARYGGAVVSGRRGAAAPRGGGGGWGVGGRPALAGAAGGGGRRKWAPGEGAAYRAWCASAGKAALGWGDGRRGHLGSDGAGLPIFCTGHYVARRHE